MNARMFRNFLVICVLLCACAACSKAPEPAAGVPPAVKIADRQDVTPEQIKVDLVGRVIRTTDAAGNGPPDEWTFEADEFKQAEILESQRMGNKLTLVILMTTRNNPKPDENSIQVSGRLRLHYELKSGKWSLNEVENLSFKYSIGIAT